MNVLVLILLISWSLVGLTVASDKFSEILATDLEILTQDFINSIKKEDSYNLQNFSKRQKRYLNKLVTVQIAGDDVCVKNSQPTQAINDDI